MKAFLRFVLPALFFLPSFLSGQMALSTSSVMSGNARYSTASVIVDISELETITMHISSPNGYERVRMVERNRFNNNPGRYNYWIPITRQSRYDLTAVHQQLDSLGARGWELVNSSYATAAEFTGLNDLYKENLYFEFRIPADPPASIEDPELYTLLLEGEVFPADRGILRGRLLKSKENTHRLVVERRVGVGWKVFYELDNEGAVAGDQAASITRFEVSNRGIAITYDLADGEYRYNFTRQPGHYSLTSVDFVANEECDLVSYSLNFAAYPDGRITGRHREEPCDATRSIKTFKGDVERLNLRLADFYAGTTTLAIRKLDRTIDF